MTSCPHCGCEFSQPRTRSSRSNRFYWAGVLGPIARELGETPESLHEAFKAKFLGREDLLLGLTFVESTAKLSQERFTQYLEQIREWSHGFLGLYIESPDEWREAA